MSLQTTFNASLTEIFRQGLPQKIAIALSGGVDSMCLTHLLQKSAKLLDKKIEIYPIMINHNLRPNSAQEVPIVQKELMKLGLHNNFLTKELRFDELHNKDSFEEVARLKRYNAIHELCKPLGIRHILFGHHMDDQLETFILRLLKNSGVFGLAGMNQVSKAFVDAPEKLNIVRPLLGVTKSEIIQYCKENDVQWVEDHTNHEEVAQRNVVRKWLNEHDDHKSETLSNFSKVQVFTKSIENKVSKLMQEAQIDQSQGTATIKLSNRQLEDNSDLVISRMLFKTLYPISPSANYHYSFNKLLNVTPRLYYDGTSFSLLQLQWDINKTSDGVEIQVSRQNPSEPIIQKVTVGPYTTSGPALFDNIYWITIRNDSDHAKDYSIKTLSKDDRQNFVELPQNFKYSQSKNLPVIIDNSTNKVLGFASDLDFVDCHVKENIYDC
jgi:tRNA(Ile)-lysidine synthetase-like protein